MLTLLWGLASDGPLAAVAEALAAQGRPAFLLDQRRALATAFALDDVAALRGHLKVGDLRIALEEITSCYVRPYDSRRVGVIERAGRGSDEWWHALQLEDALLAWLELTAALVVNRPSTMLPNASKPYQLGLIAQSGFAIPESLVTTDPREVESFWERHGEVIYKSVSGVRSRISRLTRAHAGRIADVTHCPTQFQQYVRGCDYRVHVVGDEAFSCRIVSDADDYRYSGRECAPPKIEAERLPALVEERAVAMSKAMGLQLSGIDLRRTAEDEWYCFEVNPSPAFTYYEQNTGQPIGAAIARVLAHAACAPT